jgi:O-antigen/teichoic acid export membrane protein
MKVVVLATALAKSGIQHSIPRFYGDYVASRTPNALRNYYGTFLFGVAGLSGLVTIATIVATRLMPDAAFPAHTRNLFLFGGVLIFTRSLQSVFFGFLRAQQQTGIFNVLEVLQKVATISLLCLLLFSWEKSVRSVLVASVVVDVVVVLALGVYWLKRHSVALAGFDSPLFLSALSFGIPMVLFEFAGIFLDCGDRFFVQRYLGSTELGYYSAAYNIAGYYYDLLGASIILALAPLFTKLWVTEGREATEKFLNRSLHIFVMITIGLTCSMIVCAPDLLVILASSRYRSGAQLLPLLVVGLTLSSLVHFTNAGLYLTKRTATMAYLVLFATVTNVVLNMLLLPRVGLLGAAIATLVSYAVLLVSSAYASRCLLRLQWQWRTWGVYIGLASIDVTLTGQVQTGTLVADLLIKAILSTILYWGGMLLLDGEVRHYSVSVLRNAPRRLAAYWI